jgi:alkanesulfonate monooxygenase SsuD/methylene tetrahydromethanopterin reductase-like flavin-dependent oxidoreductase (luciferase family)
MSAAPRDGLSFGVGLFSLASTAFQPRHWALAHRDLREYAALLEELGYDELWFSQHHFFYDGQCPSPLTAAASALAETTNLRVGTGILLLPMFDPRRLAYVSHDLNDRSGGRLDLGVGLGFRDIEFDGRGLARRDRLPRFLAGLEILEETEERGGARVWVGANSPATVARGGSRNHPVLMSGLNSLNVCKELRAAHRRGWEDAGCPGGIWPAVSAYRNIWVTDDANERAVAFDWVRASYVQYAGLGLSMASQAGSAELDFVGKADAALRTVVETTITGSADVVARQLVELEAMGFEQIAFRLVLDGAPRAAVENQLRRIASEVLPLVRKARS